MRTNTYIFCLFLFLFPLAYARAQTPSEKAAEPEGISAESVRTRIKQLDDAKDIEEAVKQKIRDCYQQALPELEAIKNRAAKIANFEQAIATAGDKLQETKIALAKLPAKSVVEKPDDLTLPQIDQLIGKKQSELDEARTQLTALEAEPKNRAARRLELPKNTSETREQLNRVEEQLRSPAPEGEPPPLTAAQRVLLHGQRRAFVQKLLLYEKEIAAYEATVELLPLQRDLAARRVVLAEEELKRWHEVANQRRQTEADGQLRRARLEAARAHPAVKRLARENAALAESRKQLAGKISEITRQLERTKEELAKLNVQFNGARNKVKAAGMTNTIGLLLRKQREMLPNVSATRRHIDVLQSAIGESQLSTLQLDERRSALANMEQQVKLAMQNLETSADPSNVEELEKAVRETLHTETEYLDASIGDHNTYFDKLIGLVNAERQLIAQTEACTKYIDERVLWIASAAGMSRSDAAEAGDALWHLFGPKALWEIGRALLLDAGQNPPAPLAALAVFAPLFILRRQMRWKIQRIGDVAEGTQCYRMTPTLAAILLTIAIAALWPGVLAYFSWRLISAEDASESCKSFGAGLAAAARIYFVLELLRALGRPRGLGEAHFGWPGENLALLRRHVKWLCAAVLPLVFLVAMLHSQENERRNDSLGRIAFIAALACFAIFVERILRPGGGVFRDFLAARRGGWMDRTRYLWYPAAVLLPLTLAGMAVAGYYYTSQQLAARMVLSIYLLLGLILLRSILLRWIRVNRRKIANAQVKQRLASGQNNGGNLLTADLPAAPPVECDLATINIQTRHLVEYTLVLAGLFVVWCVWVDVLPALGILNRVEIWPAFRIAENAATAETAETAAAIVKSETGMPIASVTLADLGLAMLVLATTLIAAKNIPGLLEMAVLQHLPLDAGARYAAATVSRYLITVVGLIFVCNGVGLGWSKVQWLVAAISVGLGFGLQEIFANFVSGLIILLERPIRVGDVITIADVSGMVSRIRMRATTIVDGDRKELIIPNKDVITGKVLNWTLSDKVNRIQIAIGIAYGSDTALAAKLLREAAANHPHVLKDPPPLVTFEAFGDSSLKFVLRCFLPNLESRQHAVHDLNMEIDRLFRENAIEIAFPQHDIHVRSMTGNWGAGAGVFGQAEGDEKNRKAA
ncbi:MAG: mechanosensitive ion channel [Pirellulales bacterium]|nr:mechanosensitive ion channel [Pirellulales bacterium]